MSSSPNRSGWARFLGNVNIDAPQVLAGHAVRPRLSGVSVWLIALIVAVPAAAQSVRATGVFSNMTYYEEAGDLVGTEIFIFYGGKSGYFALVQCSPSFPTAPVLATAKVTGNHIEFTLPATENSYCPAATFTGTVTEAELRGSFDSGTETYVLPRKASYWQ